MAKLPIIDHKIGGLVIFVDARSVSVVAAHYDDEVFMCGGLLSALAKRHYDLQVYLYFICRPRLASGDLATDKELKTYQDDQLRAARILGIKNINQFTFLFDLEDENIDERELTRLLPGQITDHSDLVITHAMGDLNRDHEAVSRAVAVSTRPYKDGSPKVILGGFVPGSTLSATQPDILVRVDDPSMFAKANAVAAYKCQIQETLITEKHPRSDKGVYRYAQSFTASWHGVGVYAEPFTFLHKPLLLDV